MTPDLQAMVMALTEAGPLSRAIKAGTQATKAIRPPMNPQLGKAIEAAIPAFTNPKGYTAGTLTGRAIGKAAVYPHKTDPEFLKLMQRGIREASPDPKQYEMLRRRAHVERMIGNTADAQEWEAAAEELGSVLHAKNAMDLEGLMRADAEAGINWGVDENGIVSKVPGQPGTGGQIVSSPKQMSLFSPANPPAMPDYGLETIRKVRERLAASVPGAPPKGKVTGAAFRNRKTGEVVKTGPIHDRSALPLGSSPDDWEDGFSADIGGFLNRDEAALYVDSKAPWLESIGAHEYGQMYPEYAVNDPMEGLPPLPPPIDLTEKRVNKMIAGWDEIAKDIPRQPQTLPPHLANLMDDIKLISRQTPPKFGPGDAVVPSDNLDITRMVPTLSKDKWETIADQFNNDSGWNRNWTIGNDKWDAVQERARIPALGWRDKVWAKETAKSPDFAEMTVMEQVLLQALEDRRTRMAMGQKPANQTMAGKPSPFKPQLGYDKPGHDFPYFKGDY